MIKLIAMDFDWTLVDHSGGKQTIQPELVEVLSAFVDAGGYAGIVSGRPSWDFKPVFDACGLPFGRSFPNYCVAREAYLWEFHDRLVAVKELNEPIANKNKALMRKLCGYVDEACKLLESNGIAVDTFMVNGDFAVEIYVAELSQADRGVELVKDFVRQQGLEDVKVHRNGVMVTLYHKDSGKGNALLRVAQHYGIKPEEILAIGDNYNDISMIAGDFGFVGACVENAVDEIKALVIEKGGYVGKGVASAGVLDVIRQLQNQGLL